MAGRVGLARLLCYFVCLSTHYCVDETSVRSSVSAHLANIKKCSGFIRSVRIVQMRPVCVTARQIGFIYTNLKLSVATKINLFASSMNRTLYRASNCAEWYSIFVMS